ncbi:unnamed protein product [Enterobius vermicularis]|uniref:Intraflagellar transport protein 80 homolog n=1 Tax=Enterobius vermicularis TaxID=51028 RepID=A0A0N4VK71_ENTVE|nr:unnamed protein product [Enterobius vermicularis]
MSFFFEKKVERTEWRKKQQLYIVLQVWDTCGRPLFSSGSHGYPITSLAWNRDGDLFAVGSYNLLRLCDKAGVSLHLKKDRLNLLKTQKWSHSLDKLSSQSVLNISWSPDGTQLVCACSNGHIVHAHIVERRVMWRNLEATQTKRKFIDVKDVVSEVGQEKLETKDRIIKIALGYHHLVVATTKQCYIFSSDNWNTPIINDLKAGSVTLITLCEQYFLLVDDNIVQIWTYEGRIQCILKIPNNIQGDVLTEATAAISNETVAIRDRIDRSLIHFYETLTGKIAGDGELKHQVQFIVAKSTTVTTIRFNDTTNMLAGLQEYRLIVWGYPAMVFIDREMLLKTIIEKEVDNLGRSASLVAFLGNHVSIRRSDAALIPCSVPPYAAGLWRYASGMKWNRAIKLCRRIQEDYLWGILAGMATTANSIDTAEIAYAALDEVEKVLFISKIHSTVDRSMKASLTAFFNNNINDAESMMIRSGLILDAIMVNISMFRWKRALELAVHYKQYIDTVLGYRQQYLKAINRTETDAEFIKQLAEVLNFLLQTISGLY